jgi:putative acetyltransferase
MHTKYRLLAAICFLKVYGIMNAENIEIKLIEPYQIEEVKRMIVEAAFEVWHPDTTFQEFEEEAYTTNVFKDLDNLQSVYFDKKGIFYVLVDDNKIVGAGAIKKIDDEVCELKRMWFLKPYRGKGLGLAMANKLVEFAKVQNYKKIRLDIWQPAKQQQAAAFYRKLGFYEIDPYNDSAAKLFMEKIL